MFQFFISLKLNCRQEFLTHIGEIWNVFASSPCLSLSLFLTSTAIHCLRGFDGQSHFRYWWSWADCRNKTVVRVAMYKGCSIHMQPGEFWNGFQSSVSKTADSWTAIFCSVPPLACTRMCMYATNYCLKYRCCLSAYGWTQNQIFGQNLQKITLFFFLRILPFLSLFIQVITTVAGESMVAPPGTVLVMKRL